MNNNEFRNKYVILGNIKIDIDSIKKCQITKKELIDLIDNLKILKSKLTSKLINFNEDLYVKIRLSSQKLFIISSKNNNINAYIIDREKKEILQTLTIEEAIIIKNKEKQIINRFLPYSRDNANNLDKHDFLLNKLIKTYYANPNLNKGSPTIMGYKVQDDFNIDL